MSQESTVHAGPEEKTMGRSSHSGYCARKTQLVKAVVDATIRFLDAGSADHRDPMTFPHQKGDQVSPFLGRYQP